MPNDSLFPDVKPMPAPPPQAAGSVPGHNKPPLEDDVRAQFLENLLAERADFLQRVEDLKAGATRVVVDSEESLGKAGDLVRMIRAAVKHVEAVHQETKAPYLAAGRVCDAEKNDLTVALEQARRTAEQPMNAYVAEQEARRRAEQARLEQQQREQAEAARARQAEIEAAAKAGEPEPDAPPLEPIAEPVYVPKKQPVRSDLGTSVSAKQVWKSKVDDYAKAFREVKSDPKVIEAIDAAIQRQVKAGKRELKGVTIWPESQAVAR